MIAGIEHVEQLIRRETGMAMGPSRMPALAVAVTRVAPGLDGATVARMAAGDRGASGMLAALIDEVAVNETFFFRHRRELATIDWPQLTRTALADGRDQVRIWSAACASGEEPYTLAMMASQAFATSTPPVSILATDISHRVLDRARVGVYRKRSVRLVPAGLHAKHLVELGEGYGVTPGLRRLVRFRHHNLVGDPMPPLDESPFDLVVCRNVLIYFEPEVATKVLTLLQRVLAPGGVLLLGTADRLCGSAFALTGSEVRAPPRRNAPARSRPRARRRGPEPVPARAVPLLAAALQAADAGRLDDALEVTGAILEADPLLPDAHYVQGVVQLARGSAAAAVTALRMALYLEPQFLLAAFALARAHDSLHQAKPARRAYAQTLRIIEAGHAEKPALNAGLDRADIEAACHARLQAVEPDAAIAGPERTA